MLKWSNANSQISSIVSAMRATLRICRKELRSVKAILTNQRYEITNHIESGNQLVVETLWKGQMAKDAGSLKGGQELRACFCIVCEFKDGKIYRQRNYDCFEAF